MGRELQAPARSSGCGAARPMAIASRDLLISLCTDVCFLWGCSELREGQDGQTQVPVCGRGQANSDSVGGQGRHATVLTSTCVVQLMSVGHAGKRRGRPQRDSQCWNLVYIHWIARSKRNRVRRAATCVLCCAVVESEPGQGTGLAAVLESIVIHERGEL